MTPGFRVAASILIAVPLLAQALKSPPEDLGSARRNYNLMCVQCHGADGDLLGYDDIVPLAGIRHRYPPDVIGRLSGAFSGRVLGAQDRDRMVQFMGTLRGSKGFADPGWLVTPYFLERKAPRVHEFRVIDARPPHAYAAAHVPNAVSAGTEPCPANRQSTAQWLGALGVTPGMMVVIYDDLGGPPAACVWWRIRNAGHEWVAVLDGGWKRWAREERLTSTVVPKIARSVYPDGDTSAPAEVEPAVSTLALGAGGWNWQSTLNEAGFRRHGELDRLVREAGFRGDFAIKLSGPTDEAAHLVLVLSLLGYPAQYDPGAGVILLGPVPIQ